MNEISGLQKTCYEKNVIGAHEKFFLLQTQLKVITSVMLPATPKVPGAELFGLVGYKPANSGVDSLL